MFYKKYEVLCKFGWGQYSTVWLVRDQFSRSLYAMKVHRSSPAYMEAAEYECRIFAYVTKRIQKILHYHPEEEINVVQLHDHFLHRGPNGVHLCLVYERLGASLLDVIRHYRGCGVPVAVARPLIASVGDDYLLNARCSRVSPSCTTAASCTQISSRRTCWW